MIRTRLIPEAASVSVVRFADFMSFKLPYPALKRWAITDRPLSGLMKGRSISQHIGP